MALKNETALIMCLDEIFQGVSDGHDIYHLLRVRDNALSIHLVEGGDPEVIEVSALLHDLHRALSFAEKKYVPPKDSLPLARHIMTGAGFDAGFIKRVCHCIEYHEEYSFGDGPRRATDLETFIIQDADNLDALGPIGIARAFQFSGAHSLPIYNPDIPIGRKSFTEAINDPSEIHHIYHKLLRLHESMNTETGKIIAQEKTDFVKAYLQQFLLDWRSGKGISRYT